MRTHTMHATILAVVVALALPATAEMQRDGKEGGASLVPTFHCIGIYWSPPEGGPEHNVLVKYRPSGQPHWRTGLPLRYHPIDTPECKADYRGSLVNLTPGTTYDIDLTLEGSNRHITCQGTTWTEQFPIQSVVKVSDRDTTLTVDRSGTAGAYVLYDGTGCTINTDNQDDVGIAVHAKYVILRGFTIENVKEHGIRLFSGHHIVIEDCDIRKWGSESEKGWGKNYQACVFSNDRDLSAVVIQRCKMHHPSWDTNSWAEKHAESTHPRGPQTVVFWESEGNHVIRYNECWSDAGHYFNDGMGAGNNGGYRGFPGADSDIYGNYIANCWDDGIEAEGGDQNVRIWNNYIEEVLIPIANAAASIGPLYIWRNISGRSHSPPGSSWDMSHGPFIKMGYAGGETWMTGHMYIFNNTIFQEDNNGAGGLGGDSRIIKHCTTRNNVLHVREGERRSIAVSRSHADNDFDYDLTSAAFPDNHEKHGLQGSPRYLQGAGFDPESKTGMFQLAPESSGMDAGVIIPNFCETHNGNQPDLGAHESGTGAMQFGVKAHFTPPGTATQSEPTQEMSSQAQAADGAWIQLFNGKDIDDWIVKLNHHEINDNYRDTFRVEDGLLKVRYDQYEDFGDRFGHLFYKEPFSHYHLAVEYRFVGTLHRGAPGYAVLNSGVMLHSQDPKTILRDQNWPISIELQFLAGLPNGKPRATGNVCTPGTHVFHNGTLTEAHIINSTAETYEPEEWVRAEAIVQGNSNIVHLINGKKVLEYSRPQIGGGVVAGYNPERFQEGKALSKGFIGLQSEGQPVDFRKVELKVLAPVR